MTLANILTVVISLAIILFFRLLDSKNRSIDKVKKFSEILKKELDDYFTAKNDSLQNASLDLEVKQTQALATVKRLENMRSEFAKDNGLIEEKNAALDKIETTLNDYNDLLEKLLGMTDRADENLNRISDETNHLDKVQKKVLDMNEKLDKISAQIPKITEEFTQLNTQQFQSMSSSILANFESKAALLQKRVETSESQCQELLSSIENNIKSAFDEAVHKAGQIENVAFETLQKEIQNRLSTVRAQEESAINAVKETLEEQIKTINTEQKAAEKEIKQHITELHSQSLQELNSVKTDFTQKISEANTALNQLIEKARIEAQQQAAEIIDSLRSEITAFSAKYQDEFTVLSKELDELSTNSAKKIEAVNAQIDETERKTNQVTGLLENKFSVLENNIEVKYSSLSHNLEKYTAEIEAKISNSFADAAGAVEKTQLNIFTEIEKQFEIYKTDMLYRFERIEKSSADVDALDAKLHEAIDEAASRASADFNVFVQDCQKQYQTAEKDMHMQSRNLTQHMQQLEKDLNDLKSRAYDNVSEKMKVFEEDFFADLGKRSDALNNAFIQWKADIEIKLNEVSAASEDERRKVELKYSENLKNQLALLTDKVREQAQRMEEYVKKAEADGINRLQSSEENISAFIEQVRSEFAHAKKASEEYLLHEFEKHNGAAQEQFKKHQNNIELQISRLAEETTQARDKANVALDAVRDDFILWRERVNQQFDEARSLFEEKLAALESNSVAMLNQVGETFKSDAEGYAVIAREEKSKIAADLDALRTHMQQAVQSFQQRSEETVEEFNKSYETMLDETQRRIREQNADAEQKVRTLKVFMQENSDKIDAAQQKMFLKIQTDTNNLNMIMDDIDKRLKNFVSQTQLFERADTLKKQLEEQIAGLKSDTTTLQTYRQTASDLEQQFIKVRRMEEELNQKLVRFTNDKKHIEEIEDDFNNLLSMSSAIDQKINELKSTGDDLQMIQLEIRRFQESLTEITARYERLEKKNEILDRTISGVDKTFETLNHIEKRLAACTQQTEQLPLRLADLDQKVSTLLDNDGKIYDAASKLDSLDTILSETETRIDKMQKSREWLAQTETRLEEINKQAQNQVKILGDLLKKDKKDSGGAAPISVRETVLKLAHQGWKTDEIARATNLSRGEVELILELGNDKK